jgi:hypothetical protein
MYRQVCVIALVARLSQAFLGTGAAVPLVARCFAGSASRLYRKQGSQETTTQDSSKQTYLRAFDPVIASMETHLHAACDNSDSPEMKSLMTKLNKYTFVKKQKVTR